MTSSSDDFRIIFDPSAIVALGSKTVDMEEKVRREIEDLVRDDMDEDQNLADLICHVIDHREPQPFTCEPFEDNDGTTGILVRAAKMVEHGTIEEGPFKGKKLMIPAPEDFLPEEEE